MRLTCVVPALFFLFTAPLYAQEAAPSAAAGLCQEEIDQGFVSLFDGKTLEGWQGSTDGYVAEGGILVCKKKGGGNLLTVKEYGDFIFRFDFKLEPNGNNGVAIRAPAKGNPAFAGMEIQILDEHYQGIQPYQAHGSIYGVVAAKRGFQKPIGQWNCEEIMCQGSRVKVTLNGTVIVDADLDKIDKPVDGRDHPGLKCSKGHIGWAGHGSRVEFRNIRIKELVDSSQ